MSWLRLMEERIKQQEHHSAKNGEPHAHKKNRVMTLIAEMWPAYLIEVLVIILGIWITLGLEQWRDNARENKLEKVYQKNLLADINTDLGSLKYCIDNTQTLLTKGNELLNFIKNPPANGLSTDKAVSDLQQILGRPKFITSDATFSDLKNSGNLHLLSDIHLKNLLFSYYSMTLNIKEAQDAEQQATIVITGPYFFKHFAMGDIGKQVISPQALQSLSYDVEFGNNLLLRIHTRNELMDGYQKANSLATELKQALEEQVKE
jgi:hypothetical protein